MSYCDGENELQVFFSPGPEALLPPASLLPFPAHGAKGQAREALFSQSLTQLPYVSVCVPLVPSRAAVVRMNVVEAQLCPCALALAGAADVPA